MSTPQSEDHPQPVQRFKGILSKLTGAGVGSLMIVAASYFELNADQQQLLLYLAPWVAFVISVFGPECAQFMISELAEIRLRFHLRRLRKLARSCEDPETRAQAEAGVRELVNALKQSSLLRAGLWRKPLPLPVSQEGKAKS